MLTLFQIQDGARVDGGAEKFPGTEEEPRVPWPRLGMCTRQGHYFTHHTNPLHHHQNKQHHNLHNQENLGFHLGHRHNKHQVATQLLNVPLLTTGPLRKDGTAWYLHLQLYLHLHLHLKLHPQLNPHLKVQLQVVTPFLVVYQPPRLSQVAAVPRPAYFFFNVPWKWVNKKFATNKCVT